MTCHIQQCFFQCLPYLTSLKNIYHWSLLPEASFSEIILIIFPQYPHPFVPLIKAECSLGSNFQFNFFFFFFTFPLVISLKSNFNYYYSLTTPKLPSSAPDPHFQVFSGYHHWPSHRQQHFNLLKIQYPQSCKSQFLNDEPLFTQGFKSESIRVKQSSFIISNQFMNLSILF